MNFRTTINPIAYTGNITHNDKLFFIGSCFAKSIESKLLQLKFKTTSNPFGVVYNPDSLCLILDTILANKPINESYIVEQNGLFYSLMHSTKISNTSKEELMQQLNLITQNSHKSIKESSHIFITFGTSWVYKNTKNNQTVNNCLKLPAKMFSRNKLSVEDIVCDFDNLFASHPELLNKVIYMTVSPIRYFKDGFIENSLSKSTLIVALHILKQKYSNIVYFPAYEIMNDDLRDYRFYEQDMIHPSQLAVDYIFDLFSDWVISPASKLFIEQYKIILNGMHHRPKNPDSVTFFAFCENMLKKITTLESKYCEISLIHEKKYFSHLIKRSE